MILHRSNRILEQEQVSDVVDLCNSIAGKPEITDVYYETITKANSLISVLLSHIKHTDKYFIGQLRQLW